jgi:hypothetical protein
LVSFAPLSTCGIRRGWRGALLDEALAETFPASDPTSMQQAVLVGRADPPAAEEAPRGKPKKKRSTA